MSVYKDLGFKNENGKIQVPSAETFRGMTLTELESYLSGHLDEQVDYNYSTYSEDVDGAYIVENVSNYDTTSVNDIFGDGSCISTFPLDGNTHNLKRIVDSKYFKTIYGNSPAASDYFGVSCAIGSDFFLVGTELDDDKGTDAGKVEMFSLDGTYIKTIYSNSPAASDKFGWSCAIGSDFFLVGSYGDDDKATDAGKVEMFSLDGTYIKTIYSNNPAAYDLFGVSCAIGSDFFLVGSGWNDDKATDAGKVEMFSLDGTYIKTIYSNSPGASDRFGISCAIGSDFFLVGSFRDDDKASDAGKVEMFSLDGTYIKTIYSNSPGASDRFGVSCAIGSDFFLVGSELDDDKGTDAGKVEMFSLDGTYIKTIYSNSPAASDKFGWSCAIGSDFFLVGSYGDDDKATDAGKVEMFAIVKEDMKDKYKNVVYEKTIYSNSPAASDYFARSCSIGSDFFLIGSYADDDKGTDTGKVEMFSLDGTYIKTIYSNSPGANDFFGSSCAIGSDFFLVGSYRDDDKATNAGKVEMFSLDGTYIKTIYSNNPASSDYFGSSCAIGPDFFLVGSYQDDDKATDAGKVEMFSLDGTYIKTIYSSSPATSDYFGISCAIGSDFFLVGSFRDDDKASDAGKVEMFSLDGTYIKTIYSNSPAADDLFGGSCAIGSDFFLVGSEADEDKGTDTGKVEMFSLDGTYIKTIYSNSPAASDYFGTSCAIGSDFFLVGSYRDDDKGTDAGKVEMFRLCDITTPLNVTYSDGKFGQAAVFNGSNSIIELTTMSQTFFKDSSFTVSMWVKHHNVSHSNSYFGVYESDSANKSLQLMSYNGNQLYFAFYTYDLIYNWTPNINEWYFLTFSFNSNTKDRQIFINGELVKSDISPYNFQGTAVPKIGKSQTYQNMDGQIDQVRIFNRALTSDEVNTLYNEKKVPSVLKTYTETEMENVPVNNTTKANVELISATNYSGWNINAFNTITPVAGDPIYLINGSVIIKVNEPCMMYSIFTDNDSFDYWHKYNILMSSDNGSTFNIPIISYDVGTSQNIWYKSSTILQPGYYKITPDTIYWRRCDNAWFFKKVNYTSFIIDPYWSNTSLLLSGDGTNNTFNYKSSTYSDVVSTYTTTELQSITYDSYGYGEYHGNGTSLRDGYGDSFLRLHGTTLTIRNPFDCWIEFNSIVGQQWQDYAEANLAINGTAVGSNLKYINGKYYAFLPSGTNLITHPDNAEFYSPAIKKLSSSNTYSLTPTGTVLQGSVGPYTGFSSAYFDGTSYLASPSGSANFGTDDFTVEFWANFKTISGDQYLLDGFFANSFAIEYYNGKWLFQLGDISYPNVVYAITANTWYHIAVVRNGTSIKMYINGSMIFDYTISSTKAFDKEYLYLGKIGNHSGSNTYNFNGYISNLRISKEALYTSNFTPSTTPVGLTANTALLANFDNAGIVDSTGKNMLQTVGNAQISTSNKKFGTGSMYFDGNGDYLSIPYNSNFDFGTGDFTIEGWMYDNGKVADAPCIFSNYSSWGANGSLSFLVGNSSIGLGNYIVNVNGVAPAILSNISIIYNQWVHYAVVRSSGVIKLYINGTSVGSYSYSGNIIGTGDYVWIGTSGDNIGSCYFNGYIDDLRITKDVARYTSDFTVPIEAFPAQDKLYNENSPITLTQEADQPNWKKYQVVATNTVGTIYINDTVQTPLESISDSNNIDIITTFTEQLVDTRELVITTTGSADEIVVNLWIEE